jgi:thiamine-monophosphate kinase
MPDEDQLIQRVARVIPSFSGRQGLTDGVPLGICDDATVIRSRGTDEWVVTVDAFVEGIHFLADRHPPESVGYKAVVRAASDLAAMGAQPRFFLLTLGLPRIRAGSWLDRMLRGMAKAARLLGLRLVGGDTTRTTTVLMSITVIGQIHRGRAVTRSGAKPGDVLYVSGRLGGGQLGLEIMLSRLRRERGLRGFLRPHLYPPIRVELGAWLASNKLASAMMDISDGLSMDLGRLCSASGVAGRVYAQKLPLVEVPARLAKQLKSANPMKMALHGGEDYELLFTIPKRLAPKLRSAPGFKNLTEIGEIVPGKGVVLVDADGRERPLSPQGWDPFRRTRAKG